MKQKASEKERAREMEFMAKLYQKTAEPEEKN